MKRFKLPIYLFGIVVGLGLFILFEFQSCTHEPMGLDTLDTVCFNPQILDIFKNSCAMPNTRCHQAGSDRGNFEATDYDHLKQLVVPGDPWKSKLYTIICSPNNPNMMPPSPYGAISPELRTLIEVWILQGAKNIKCPTDTTTAIVQKDTVCFEQSVLPIINSNCKFSGCHDGSNSEDAKVFTDYNSLSEYIISGSANSSPLYTVLLSSGENKMPRSPYAALSSTQISTIQKWINQGAVNSNCPSLNCDTTGSISFANQVWPILQPNCVGCHGVINPGGNVNLTSYDQINTTSVQVKKNNIALLVGASNHYSSFISMPPSGSLSTCDVRKITLWVQQGAFNN